MSIQPVPTASSPTLSTTSARPEPASPHRAAPSAGSDAQVLLRQYSSARPAAAASGKPSIAKAPSAAQSAAALLDKYDGGAHSRNEAADRSNTLLTLQSASLSMTGLPPAETEMNLDELQFEGALAQMSDDKRAAFTQRADALRHAPPEEYAGKLPALMNDVDAELRNVEADPVQRMNAIFNAPVGISVLGKDADKSMAALRAEQTKMNAPGTSPARREAAFANAVKIKTQIQTQIARKTEDLYATQQKQWSESKARVTHLLDEADKYNADSIALPRNSDDPEWDTKTRKPAYAKTFPYQSVLEKLLSADGYSRQERGSSAARTLPAEDRVRDLLTFQQEMSNPNSEIHKRVDQLEKQALQTMAHPGEDLDEVHPTKTIGNTAAHPPAYDRNYIQNLASGYQSTLKDIDDNNRWMLREHVPGLFDKVLYGMGRYTAKLSPIPGMDWFANQLLDAEFPDHGGLSDAEVKSIDMSAMISGLLMGRWGFEDDGFIKPPMGETGAPPPPIEGHDGGSPTPPSPPDPAPARTTLPPGGDQHGAPSPGTAANGGATAAKGFTASGLPASYALPHTPASYGASSSPGVQVDHANGQTFILADNRAFAVQYDRFNATWRVIDPDNPVRPGYPVRYDAQNARWEVHQEVGLAGGYTHVTPELRAKVEGLLRDGWSTPAITRKFYLTASTIYKIRKSMDLPVGPMERPLHNQNFKNELIARLANGASEEQLAQDLHVEPETVEWIIGEHCQQELARHLLKQTSARGESPVLPASPPAVPDPGSPQPGTSTGGATYPTSVRQVSDPGSPPAQDPLTQQVMARVANYVPTETIAHDLNLTPSAVEQIIDRYMTYEIARFHQEFLAEQAAEPPVAPGTPPIAPDVRQSVIDQLNGGFTSAQIAASHHLSVFQVDQIRDQYLQESLSQFDMELLEQ